MILSSILPIFFAVAWVVAEAVAMVVAVAQALAVSVIFSSVLMLLSRHLDILSSLPCAGFLRKLFWK